MCGCHFPEDFKDTLKPTCNFWGDRGGGNIPVEWKRKVWDWQFSINYDQLFADTGMQLTTSWGFNTVDIADTFKTKVPGWDKMPDAKRRLYEKDHFKKLWREQAKQNNNQPIKMIVKKPSLREMFGNKKKILN